MYNINSVVIAAILFLLILLANEVARRSAATVAQSLSAQTIAIQALNQAIELSRWRRSSF